ncbi:TspO/MBR family protein [Pseudovibrio ascidiaceicola]|uniref:TspO and MBR related proteins n=1 Tax=Pseudovibrio ascidiaceicola TaxID=285279 RepID=A0A1I3V936_9HYPH|nr:MULTISPECIES: TspO/MBR family protein [Pseudovibrio]KZL07821.1 TspO/MBR family protein [Pseudovibrio sp. Ad26]SFJ91805.1 TspO and MBR related proteins [Pseudovibrio ascidiaceicola]
MPLSDTTKAKLKNRVVWSRLVGWGLLCYATAAYGGIVTAPAIPEWYASLNKPSFNPPDWIFAPVWSVLYALLGISIWLATEFQQTGTNEAAKPPSKTSIQLTFVIVLFLNGIWSWAFFGQQNPTLGLVVLIILLALSFFTFRLFYRAQIFAAWLYLPYLLWVSFAAVLNASIVVLN